MKFDYESLKKAERNGTRLGAWRGKSVFAVSKDKLSEMGSGAYYVVYNDNNRIVARDGKMLKSYGEVSERGEVKEYSSVRTYKVVDCAPVEPVTSGSSESEKTVGDVKLGIDVDDVLKKVRTMTIADLLEGFNYGLD